jgi:hypothetical protein
VCQLNKNEHVASPGLLQSLPIPEGSWACVTMDFVCGLPKSDGKDVLLVVIDRFTKYCHLLTLTHPFRAREVAQVYMNNVYRFAWNAHSNHYC